MGFIVVPVGLLASNSWIVLLCVFMVIYCLMLYFFEYAERKFSFGHRGSTLFTTWLLIIFLFFVLAVLFQTAAVIMLFLDIILIPVVLLWLLPPYQHLSGLVSGNADALRIVLASVAVIYILYISFTGTDGFGLLA
jgi:hypothetical protein